MIEINHNKILESLGCGGYLLTAGNAEKANTLTVSWSGTGVFWNKPVIIVPIRKSRFTHGFIEQEKQFTICVLEKEKQHLLHIFGTKSGRDVNKYEISDTRLADAKQIRGQIIDEAGWHFECKVIYQCDMDITAVDSGIKTGFYSDGDAHTLYFAEIITAYKL